MANTVSCFVLHQGNRRTLESIALSNVQALLPTVTFLEVLEVKDYEKKDVANTDLEEDGATVRPSAARWSAANVLDCALPRRTSLHFSLAFPSMIRSTGEAPEEVPPIRSTE